MNPASIRYYNPGAAYPSAASRRFGSTGEQIIGGGHKIAVFDDPVKGAAYNFDLARRLYADMPLNSLIAKWSGGNNSGAYTDFVSKRLGLSPGAMVTSQMLADPAFATGLLKAKSYWESGRKEYPLDDAGWAKAHQMAYSGAAPGVASSYSYGGSATEPDNSFASASTADAPSASRDLDHNAFQMPQLKVASLQAPTSPMAWNSGKDRAWRI